MSDEDSPDGGVTRVVSVELDQGRDYDIFIGPGTIHHAAEYLPFDVEGRAAFVVTDENAAPYARAVGQALEQAGAWPVHTLTLAPGEATKSFATLGEIADWLLERRVRRSSPVFAVGGGVVGDIVGFAAAVALRGLPYVQVPTTLLSQVDSAVGGKTGLNVAAGKNLIGAFYQPRAVFIDTDALKTLGARERRSGYAEILKYALIGDPEMFAWLEASGQAVLDLEPGAAARAIEMSCAAKARIVGADEREAEGGRRALLNLGHTFGHALEAATGYDGRLTHGEAVSIGTVMALDTSVRLDLAPEADYERVLAHMEALSMPTRAAEVEGLETTPGALMELMQADKKAGPGGALNFVLLEGIGQAFVTSDVPEDVLGAVLADSLG